MNLHANIGRPTPVLVRAYVVRSACQRHLADVGIVLFTALFVVVVALIGLRLAHGG